MATAAQPKCTPNRPLGTSLVLSLERLHRCFLRGWPGEGGGRGNGQETAAFTSSATFLSTAALHF